MQAKKSTKVLSALAMAAAAAASAQMAHGATLSLYYGADASGYANSNNGLYVGTAFDSSGTNSNAQSETQSLIGATQVTPVVGGPTTINMAVGNYLEIAIDAVLTGNPNAALGAKQSGDAFVQPSFLGLSALGMTVSSSDATGTKLTPFSTQTSASTTINTLPSYLSTAVINSTTGSNGSLGYNAAPAWTALNAPGDVQPNLPGFDTSPKSSGGVGLGSTSPTGGAFPAGGNTSANAGTTSSIPTSVAKAVLEAFGSGTNASTYAAATDFLDSLAFKALAAGTITLTPNIVAGGTEFWKFNGNATVNSKTTSTYAATPFGSSDVINNLPTLVVVIAGGASGHPIVNYAGAANSSYSPTIGTLTVTGHNGSYTVASITGINGGAGDATGTAEAVGFNPASDEEIYAVDVLVNGGQATAGELSTLVAAINAGDANVGASAGVVATTSSPVPNPFGSGYNLYLDPQGFSPAFLGLDLSSTNDPLLSGYTFSAIAVVPEPMTLGLLALGGVGLMARRHRRKV